MSEPLFDLADEYDAMLQQGLRLTGESKDYFARLRVRHAAQAVPNPAQIKRVLDFGCGLGDTCALLLEAFPQAHVVGVDNASRALAKAVSTHGSSRISFEHQEQFVPRGDFDLCYVNGVFHHIPAPDREAALHWLHRALRPSGILAFYENNPWNPGTKMVMRRIPFDRDAQTLSPLAARQLLGASGFRAAKTRSYFYFPRALRWLRWLEPLLARVPLGGQYLVLARRLPTFQPAPASLMGLAAS